MQTHFEATFRQEKETKNAVRYQEIEDGSNPVGVGTLYVKKSALPSPAPELITVAIKIGDDDA